MSIDVKGFTTTGGDANVFEVLTTIERVIQDYLDSTLPKGATFRDRVNHYRIEYKLSPTLRYVTAHFLDRSLFVSFDNHDYQEVARGVKIAYSLTLYGDAQSLIRSIAKAMSIQYGNTYYLDNDSTDDWVQV